MDSAYFEDLAGRLYGLLIGLDDRIGREQAQWLHHVIDAGEYVLALETSPEPSPRTRSR